jgi:2-aminoadipate transaminase
MCSMDWTSRFAERARNRGGAELAAILSGPGPGVLAMTGGFPNVATFQTEVLGEIAARVIATDPGVALQYGPSAGLASTREYLRARVAATQGVAPAEDELIVTSGGMECIDLLCRTMLEPGDGVAIEAPTYLGAILAFTGYGAELTGIPMDEEGMLVDELAARFARGYRPKFVYVIPEYQNPSGRTLSLERRRALIDACRTYGVLIFEDVAYRELSFDGTSLPSLWSLGPDVVVQAGTFSKIFSPGFRMGWALGPAELVAPLADAKQNTDQCAGALGQRMVEEYGRGGHFDAGVARAQALYSSHWAALAGSLSAHMPEGVVWSEPTGGMFTWLSVPAGIDVRELRSAATEARVAYVPGRAFYVGDAGDNAMRLSYSSLSEADLDEAGRRLAGVIASALAFT